MSLINDALKRASQSKPAADGPDSGAAPLSPAPTTETRRPPTWLLVGFPVVLFLVCGIAGWLIYEGWRGKTEFPATAVARETEREVAPTPSNQSITVIATNVSTNAVVPAEPQFPTLKLQGVFYRPGNPSAIINSKTVYRGDKVDEARILAIGKTNVTVEWKGERRVLIVAPVK